VHYKSANSFTVLITLSLIHEIQIQHGSFGGPSLTRDSYYAAGSDDFRGYVWKIPDLADLAARRREVDVVSWPFESPDTTGKSRFFLP
jgi:hypothetical protein